MALGQWLATPIDQSVGLIHRVPPVDAYRLRRQRLAILDSCTAAGFETFLKRPCGLFSCFVNGLTRVARQATAHPIGSTLGIGEWQS